MGWGVGDGQASQPQSCPRPGLACSWPLSMPLASWEELGPRKDTPRGTVWTGWRPSQEAHGEACAAWEKGACVPLGL